MMIGAVLGTLAILIVAIGVGYFISKRGWLLPAPDDLQRKKLEPAPYAAGEAPASALRIRRVQLERLRTSQVCPTCKCAMTGGLEDRVRYDNQDLLVLPFHCRTCNTKRTLYVRAIE